MSVVDLAGREHEAAVINLLAAAQTHRSSEDALTRAPSIGDAYARSETLRLWGDEFQGDVVGVVGVERVGPDAAVIRDLAVAPEKRRHGIGRALLDFLRSEGGLVALEGDTVAAAAPFYERCGFRVSEEGRMPDGATRYRFVWPR